MKAVFAVKAAEVKGFSLFGTAWRKGGVKNIREYVHQTLQGGFGVEILACFQFHGDRIGDVRGEGCLIEVQTDAADGGRKHFATDTVFDEDAADFPVAAIDVVGPFDPGTDAVLLKKGGYGKGCDLAYQEL